MDAPVRGFGPGSMYFQDLAMIPLRPPPTHEFVLEKLRQVDPGSYTRFYVEEISGRVLTTLILLILFA